MILKEVQRIMLSEKAKSKAQQRFFGMVRAAQKGEMDNPSSEVVDAADSMKVDDVKKFAKTKHKGLPEKKEVKEGMKEYEALKKEIHARGPVSEKPKQKKKKKKGMPPIKTRNKSQFQSIKSRVKKGKHKLYKLKDVNKPAQKQSMQGVGGFRGVHGASRKSKAAQGKQAPVVYSYKKKEQVNEVIGQVAGGDSDGMMNWGMNNNPYLKSVAGALVPGGKQKAKKEVKQKSAEVTGNVADKISKPIGGTRVQESKGTAELATLALRNKKRCAECGSFAHVTGQCPKKDHGVVNKRTITSEEKKYPYGKASKNNPRGKRDQAELDRAQAYIKKNPNFGRERGKKDQAELDRAQAYIKKNPNFGVKEAKEEEGRSDYGKASVRNKRRFGKEGKPAVIDPTNERGKMIDKRREEHQQRQVRYEGVMDIVRRYTDKKKPEKKPQKAMDAGARAKRQLARKVHAKYVSGSTENVPDDIRDHKTWSDFRKHI